MKNSILLTLLFGLINIGTFAQQHLFISANTIPDTVTIDNSISFTVTVDLTQGGDSLLSSDVIINIGRIVPVNTVDPLMVDTISSATILPGLTATKTITYDFPSAKFMPGNNNTIVVWPAHQDFESDTLYKNIYGIEATSINEFTEVIIESYPNPTTDYLHINWNDPSLNPIAINAFNMNGQLVRKYRPNSLLHVADLPLGSYLFNIEFENGLQKTFKVLIR